MRLWPECIHESVLNLRWGIELRLQLIEEVACAPQASGTGGGPSKEEAEKRLRRAVRRRDTEAEDAAFADWMRVEVREWWQAYPERRLLTDLYRRAARKREKPRSLDSRATYNEGLQVARALLAHIAAAALFDFARESEAVSIVLADQWASRDGKRRPAELRVYIDYAGSSRAYFDSCRRIEQRLHDLGEPIPGTLARWRAEAAGGLRRRPAKNPVASHPPVKPAHLMRDVQVQFAIEVLSCVGIRPMGSGCRIVSAALAQIAAATGRDEVALSEHTVTRIWKERAGERPFEPELRKQMKAIAGRTGPFHTH